MYDVSGCVSFFIIMLYLYVFVQQPDIVVIFGRAVHLRNKGHVQYVACTVLLIRMVYGQI